MNKVPEHINSKILNEIKSRLNPDLKILFLKLFIIHLVTALITLTICPQLGYRLAHTPVDLMVVFMKVAPTYCDAACGAFFTMSSIVSSLFILSRDELRVLRHKKTLATAMITLTSLGFLIMLSPALFLQISFLWLIGCIGGTWVSLDLGTRVLKFS